MYANIPAKRLNFSQQIQPIGPREICSHLGSYYRFVTSHAIGQLEIAEYIGTKVYL